MNNKLKDLFAKIFYQHSIVYKVLDASYVTSILSELKISIDFLDQKNSQKYSDFIHNKNPKIQYKADDFIILLSADIKKTLNQDGIIDLNLAEHFGWYDERIHRVRYKIYEFTENLKVDNLLLLNPALRIDSFAKFRDSGKMMKYLNVLSGGFGLCYYVYKNDYEEFLSKIKVSDINWKIHLDKLEKKDYAILLQLILFNNAPNKDIIDSLLEGMVKAKILEEDDKKPFQELYSYLEICLSYFIDKNYSMTGILNYLSNESLNRTELKKFSEGFQILNEQYVEKGIPVDTGNQLLETTKQFLDIGKTETGNLTTFFEDKNFSKTSVFLLGMLHLGDRLYAQFEFDNFIQAFVGLTARNIKSIEIHEKYISFYFSEDDQTKIRYQYVNNYLEELRQLKTLKVETEEIKNDIEEKEQLSMNLDTSEKAKELNVDTDNSDDA